MFVAAAWGVPLLLAVVAGTALGPLELRPYLLDPGVWARSFLAIGFLILAETQVENQLRDGVKQFFAGQLVTENALGAARSAMVKALERRNSMWAELICLLFAVTASLLLLSNTQNQTASSWAVTVANAQRSLSAAAWWSVIVSNTLFWFLLSRSVWRHVIWSLLLLALSRLETRLVATHPDGHAGLAFVGRYPNAYMLFTVAVSSVVSAAVTHQILHSTITASALGAVMALSLIALSAYFGIPLLCFVRQILDLKKRTLLAASTVATNYQRQVERGILGKNVVADDDNADVHEELADPGKLFEAAKKLSPMLVTRSTLIPVFAAALLPFVLVGLTQLPFKELLPIVKRLLLL